MYEMKIVRAPAEQARPRLYLVANPVEEPRVDPALAADVTNEGCQDSDVSGRTASRARGLPAKIVDGMRQFFAQHEDRRRRARCSRALASLDKHTLRDIGIDPFDLLAAESLRADWKLHLR